MRRKIHESGEKSTGLGGPIVWKEGAGGYSEELNKSLEALDIVTYPKVKYPWG